MLNNASLNFGIIRHSQPRFGTFPYQQGHQIDDKSTDRAYYQQEYSRSTPENAETALRESFARRAHHKGLKGQDATNYVTQKMQESNVYSNNTHAYFHNNLQRGMSPSDALDRATDSANFDRSIDKQIRQMNKPPKSQVTTHTNQHGDRVELAFGPDGVHNTYNKDKKPRHK